MGDGFSRGPVTGKTVSMLDLANKRIAELESLLIDVDAVLEFVWPHFGGEDAERISRVQKRVIDAVSN